MVQGWIRLGAILCLSAVVACGGDAAPITPEDVDALEPLNAISTSNLTKIILTVSNPEDAVDYFREGLAREPDNLEFRRGLGQSLAQAGRHTEAAILYQNITADGITTEEDRLIYAEILVRENEFEAAAGQLAVLDDQPNKYSYNLLNAVVADHYEQWSLADGYYERARSLKARPTAVLNN